MLRDELLDALRVGIDQADALAVATLEPIHEVVRFLVETTRVDADDVDLGNVRPDEIGEHHGFGAEAVGVDHAAMHAHRFAQQVHDLLRLGGETRSYLQCDSWCHVS